MKKRYKYDIGIVHLTDDSQITITSNDLEDEGIRVKYKGEIIIDSSGENILHIRSRGISSHFYSRGSARKNIRGKKYFNDKHKEKIDILCKFLNARDRVRICCYYFENRKPKLDTIFSFREYFFSKEVKQSIDRKNYFVADIYGVSKSLNYSNSEPHIAIEVIDNHFPDYDTFNYLRGISKEMPLIILFYYLEFEPIINCMYNNKGDSNNGKLRIAHYIQDGSFWVGDERIEEKDYSFIKTYKIKIDFNNNEEYYKSIDELELKRLKK
jgi:hypothetical protein